MTFDAGQTEVDVVLRDGSTVHLRPAHAGDRDALRDLYQRLSPESRYYRFAGKPHVDRVVDDVVRAVAVEGAFTLLAEVDHRVVAIGQYVPTPDVPGRAEAAFAVADAYQGHGIATKLLERLGAVARANGITALEAYLLFDNQKMRQVFVDAGFDLTWDRVEGSTSRVVLSLRETDTLRDKVAVRSRFAAHASLAPFFQPHVVAVVGAGHRRGGIGAEIYHNLIASGFRGRVVPVTASGGEIEGAPSVTRVTAIEGDVSLAVIAVPSEHVSGVVEDCIAKGVKALVIISAGFSEAGEAGRAREEAILDRVRAAGIRMIGPNCMGILNTDPAVRLNATFAPSYPPEGRVGFSTQSGALGLAILDYARRLNIGISTFVSIGNKADVSGNDLIQYWANDPRTDVILLYLESFGNPRKFRELAREIGRSKPIVAVKAGRSAAGARAASSHTGALASSDIVVEALFRQSGVIRTYTLEELFDVAAMLAHQPIPSGRRVAILTNAGGPAILAADACEANGLEVSALSVSTRDALRAFLPAAASVGNPVDMLASAPAEHYERAMQLLLADGEIDSLLTIYIPPLVTQPKTVAEAMVRGASGSRKPVLATFMSAQGAPPELGAIPCYMFPEAAATALARVVAHGEWRRRTPGTIPTFGDCDVERARSIVERTLVSGGGWLSPADVYGILESFGIAAALPVSAATEDAAVAAARRLEWPVALKAAGSGILHKTDVGGVALNLADEDSVRRAYRDMAQRLGDRLSGVIVQRMVPGGVEVLVGATLDPTFGPVIACGTGGTLVELFADVIFRLQPLTDVDAAEMVNQMKGAPLLRGFRGAPRADEAALRDVLLRMSALLESCPDIQEVDINPLKVLSRGVCALDARIRVERRPRARTRRISY